jgi:hypothetical protein
VAVALYAVGAAVRAVASKLGAEFFKKTRAATELSRQVRVGRKQTKRLADGSGAPVRPGQDIREKTMLCGLVAAAMPLSVLF